MQSLADPNCRAFKFLVKEYKKNNLYLAEAARALRQNVKYVLLCFAVRHTMHAARSI